MTRVLKAEHVVAVRGAAAAQAEAKVAAEAERQQAVASSYAAGFDAGRTAARAEAAATAAEAGARVAAALEQLAATAAAQQAAAVDVSSRAVLASAIDIAEWVLRHELATDTRSVLARLGEAAQLLLPAPTARVTVSAHDEDAVRAWAGGRGVEVVVDAALPAGDAHFDNGTGSVDVTVAAALRIAAESLGVDPARGVR